MTKVRLSRQWVFFAALDGQRGTTSFSLCERVSLAAALPTFAAGTGSRIRGSGSLDPVHQSRPAPSRSAPSSIFVAIVSSVAAFAFAACSGAGSGGGETGKGGTTGTAGSGQGQAEPRARAPPAPAGRPAPAARPERPARRARRRRRHHRRGGTRRRGGRNGGRRGARSSRHQARGGAGGTAGGAGRGGSGGGAGTAGTTGTAATTPETLHAARELRQSLRHRLRSHPGGERREGRQRLVLALQPQRLGDHLLQRARLERIVCPGHLQQ